MEKSEQVGEIDPKSTIQTTGVEPTIHERVMPLHHHEPFAFQAMHRPTLFPLQRFRGRPGASRTATNAVTGFSEDD